MHKLIKSINLFLPVFIFSITGCGENENNDCIASIVVTHSEQGDASLFIENKSGQKLLIKSLWFGAASNVIVTINRGGHIKLVNPIGSSMLPSTMEIAPLSIKEFSLGKIQIEPQDIPFSEVSCYIYYRTKPSGALYEAKEKRKMLLCKIKGIKFNKIYYATRKSSEQSPLYSD